MSHENTFVIKAYAMKQLREMYGASWKTWREWLTAVPDLGEYRGKAYTPAQVQKIVNHIGRP